MWAEVTCAQIPGPVFQSLADSFLMDWIKTPRTEEDGSSLGPQDALPTSPLRDKSETEILGFIYLFL